MNRILALLLILLSGISAFSQIDLFVSNNASIFVDGDGFDDGITGNAPLFVTDNIQLSGANSFIYLRDGAQLLQGSGTTTNGNSGAGFLSVYQEGTVNRYSYNYWCSPIGEPGAAANGNAFSASYMKDPNTDTSSNNFTINHNTILDGNDMASPKLIAGYWIWRFGLNTGTVYPDWEHIGNLGTIEPGYGYTMKGTNATTTGFDPNTQGQRIDFRGKPNNGDIETDIVANEFTLIGNPYPSAIDARAFIHDAANTAIDSSNALNPIMTGALHYWEQRVESNHNLVDYRGGYAVYTISNAATPVESFVGAPFNSYNGDGTLNTNGSTTDGTKTARRYIPVGQGFMVEGANGIAANSTVTMKNSFRVYKKEAIDSSFFFNPNQQFSDNAVSTENNEEIQYNQYGLSIVPPEFKRFRINIDFNKSSNFYTRQLLLNFDSSATHGFDYGLEAKGGDDITNDAYFVLDEDPYIIQAYAFETTLAIPLVVKIAEQQNVRFRIFDIQNFDGAQPIFLHDIEADLYVDLREQNYEVNLEVGTYTDRFKVVFERESLGIDEETLSDFLVFQDNANAALTIKNPNNLNVTQVTLFDVAGKQLFNETNLPIAEAHTFSTRNMSDGVYLAQVVIDHTRTINKKVIVKN